MNCPKCKSPVKSVELEKGLPAGECVKCHGHWISSQDYFQWAASRENAPSKEPELEISLLSKDSGKTKICPECGHILLRYFVGLGADFYLDHCNNCNGVWFDANEWEILKARNLHDDIQDICSSEWQKKIRKETMREKMEEHYRSLFGEQDFEEITRVKKWIEEHPLKKQLTIYLFDPDPFKW